MNIFFLVESTTWYADIVTFLVEGMAPPHWTTQDLRRFKAEVKYLFYDDPYLFKY